jgi:drug/metabolite transporter (DMT)-like permease
LAPGCSLIRLMNPWTPLLLATLGWGASNVLSKAVLNSGLDTFRFLPIRYLIGLVSLLAFLAATGRLHRPERRAWKLGAVLGIFNMSIPTLLMTKGLEYIPATMGSLLISLIPIATVTAAHFVVHGERFRPHILPGFLISMVGVALLVGGGVAVVSSLATLLTGVGLTLAGVTIAGVGGAVSRRFTVEISPARLVVPQFAFGFLALLIGLAVVGGGRTSPIDANLWWLLGASGVVGTALPFAAFLFAAEINPASRLAITGYTVPVIGTIGALIFLGETFTGVMVVGALLIIAGVYISERIARYVPPPGAQSAV